MLHFTFDFQLHWNYFQDYLTFCENQLHLSRPCPQAACA